MGISENAAYIKGLFDGYEIDTNTKEGKIISKMLELLSDMADKINALEADNKDLHEYVEELDHDLGEVEEEVYFCDDYDDEEYDDYDDLTQDDHYDYHVIDTLFEKLDNPYDDWDLKVYQYTITKNHYGNIRRNDLCVCGSGKKFKECCALNIGKKYPHYKFVLHR